MLKLDGCYASPAIYSTGYPNMSRALNATGRPIVFSCSWPAYIPNVSNMILYSPSLHPPPSLQPNYTEIAEYCNLWRNYDDISDSWDSVQDIISHYAQFQDKFQPIAGPGQWNDPDMVQSQAEAFLAEWRHCMDTSTHIHTHTHTHTQLIIGDFGLSLDEQRAQMALWAIFAAVRLCCCDTSRPYPLPPSPASADVQ